MQCGKCGYTFRDFEDTCPRCRQTPDADGTSWTCPNCAAKSNIEARSCWQCGTLRQRSRVLLEAKLGTFGMRLTANVVDVAVILIAATLIYLVVLVVSPEWATQGGSSSGFSVDQVMFLTALLLSLVYNVAMLTRWGCTIGKLILRLRVVQPDGSAPSLWQATVRTFGWFASLATFGLVFLVILRDPMRRGLHDRLANTLVIRV